MTEKGEKTHTLPSSPADATVAKINVHPPQDRPPESPYMDPATGRLIPIEERDWRRGPAPEEAPPGGTFGAVAPSGTTNERDVLDPNDLDFSIERKESRLPPEE